MLITFILNVLYITYYIIQSLLASDQLLAMQINDLHR